MTIEGNENKIKKLRKELELKVKRNGLTFKEDKKVEKVEVKEPKKKTVKK